MNNNNKIDIEKLNRLQLKMDRDFESIKTSFNKILERYRKVVIDEFGFIPDGEFFTTWYFDNFLEKKYRRIPPKVNYEDVAMYCRENLQEVLGINQQSTNVLTPKQKVSNEVSKLFNDDSFISLENKKQIINEVTYIITEEKLPSKIIKITHKEIGTELSTIRYSFFNIYLIKKKTNIRFLLIQYLHTKFQCFEKFKCKINQIQYSETYKKFAPPRKNN